MNENRFTVNGIYWTFFLKKKKLVHCARCVHSSWSICQFRSILFDYLNIIWIFESIWFSVLWTYFNENVKWMILKNLNLNKYLDKSFENLLKNEKRTWLRETHCVETRQSGKWCWGTGRETAPVARWRWCLSFRLSGAAKQIKKEKTPRMYVGANKTKILLGLHCCQIAARFFFASATPQREIRCRRRRLSFPWRRGVPLAGNSFFFKFN